MGEEKGKRKGLTVITGCDSGIGLELARILAGRGYRVLASFLGKPGLVKSDGIAWVSLDLRKQDSISAFAEAALSLAREAGGLGALVHNAGMAAAWPLEPMPMEVMREVFEVNFFGLTALTKALLPRLLVDRGRIVIVGSTAGRLALPYFSPYCASKHALVGLADSLRRELGPLGLAVILAEPRAVATPIWERTLRRTEESVLPLIPDRYREPMRRGGARLAAQGSSGLPAAEAAGRIARILETERPRARYVIARHPLLTRIQAALPAGLADMAIRRVFGQ